MNTQHMNDKLLTVEEAALAWAQGKRVEAKAIEKEGAKFVNVEPVGVYGNGWSAYIFNSPSAYHFRLANEPPAKKLRPYKREELAERIGRRIQTKAGLTIGMLSAVDSNDCGLVGLFWYSSETLLENWEWVGGEPCGVEVDA